MEPGEAYDFLRHAAMWLHMQDRPWSKGDAEAYDILMRAADEAGRDEVWPPLHVMAMNLVRSAFRDVSRLAFFRL